MARSRLAFEINLAGVLLVQLVELRADFPPDAGLLRRVVDQRRAEPFQAVLAAQGEQLLPPLDVRLVAEPGVARLQFQFGHVGRRDHGLGVDGRAVFDEGVGSVHWHEPWERKGGPVPGASIVPRANGGPPSLSYPHDPRLGHRRARRRGRGIGRRVAGPPNSAAVFSCWKRTASPASKS